MVRGMNTLGEKVTRLPKVASRRRPAAATSWSSGVSRSSPGVTAPQGSGWLCRCRQGVLRSGPAEPHTDDVRDCHCLLCAAGSPDPAGYEVVAGDDAPYAYTVGLWHSCGHPEV